MDDSTRHDDPPAAGPPTADDDLADFFASPDAPPAASASSSTVADRPAATPAAPVDEELAAFFASPDARAAAVRARSRGDGAPGAAGIIVEPGAPSAPPPPTGPAAERRRRTGRVLAVLLGLVGLGVLGTVSIVVWLAQDLPSFEQIENPQNYLATQVVTADGIELARYYDGENRTWVSLDEMSPLVPQALIATEDRRFFQHWGLDMQALAAVAKDIVAGKGARGASTITMQLARNLYRKEVRFTTGDRSIVRKGKEILTAIRIERTYTKREILEAYLNTVPFLYNAFGIEAASQTFFSKPSADLNAEEAATLVGMLAANTRYNPCGDPEGSAEGCEAMVRNNQPFDGISRNPAAIERRNVVLANMRRADVLDQTAFEAARDSPIELHVDPYSHEDNLAPHFAEVLRLWLKEWIETRPGCEGYTTAEEREADPDCNIYTAGLVVRSTLDSRMQALATDAVREEMNDLQRIVNTNRWGTTANPFGYWWSRNTAVVNEYIRATPRFTELTSGRGSMSVDEAVQELRRDSRFMDSLKTVRTRLEAGLIAIDPTSGQVKAWVGGRDFIANKFDHGGQARRQAGSTFKLFAYTTAFNNGYSPESTALDLPFSWGDWRPENSGNSYAGNVTLASALQASRNVVAARITQHFGQAEIARTAYQMGVRSPLELPPPIVACGKGSARRFGVTCEPGQTFGAVSKERWAQDCPAFAAQTNDCYPRSIALGTQDVSLLEMVAGYATVANYGVYHGPTLEEQRPRDAGIPPHIVLAVDRIEDRYGNVIEDFTPIAREVLNPSTAYTVFDAMRSVVRAGTGRALGGYRGVGPLDVAGKTGTTQENADGWFVAMTPQLVVGSWTGFDDRRITYPSTSVGQGGRTGLRNVGAFLSRLQTSEDSTLRLDPSVRFEKPDNYQPPSRRGRIGSGGYLPGSARDRTRSRGQSGRGDTRTRIEREGERPARELLDRLRDRDRSSGSAPAPEPRPQTQGGGTGGRIGW